MDQKPHNPITSARNAGVLVHDDNPDLFGDVKIWPEIIENVERIVRDKSASRGQVMHDCDLGSITFGDVRDLCDMARVALATPRPAQEPLEATAARLFAIWDKFIGGDKDADKEAGRKMLMASCFAATAFEDAVDAPITYNTAPSQLLRTFLIALSDPSSTELDAYRACNRVEAQPSATCAENAQGDEVERLRSDPALPRLTQEMIEAACLAHYGKRLMETVGGHSEGVSMTANGIDYSFPDAFRRMWSGIRAALRAHEQKGGV